MTSHKLTQIFLALAALMIMAMSALADPGVQVADVTSDQRAGSVLIYNIYASNSTDPTKENTRLSITNSHDAEEVFVHLFFVDGATCAVADSYICLSKSQTVSILASDVDPDVRGYLVAVAVNPNGTPRHFNHLIGDEYVKLSSGHIANLGAEAIPALWTRPQDAPTPSSPTGDISYGLNFNGVQYGALPRVLAVDNLASSRDGNDTLLIVNSIRGNLGSGVVGAGSMFGILFDELEAGFSYTFMVGCQFRASLSDSFPRTAPRFTNVVPAGTVGWTKFWATADRAILGAVINKNTSNSAASFNGGHNLHKLTYTTANILDIPVFTAMCS
jgi:hypothetical protein